MANGNATGEVNASHVVATGGTTAMLADVIVWLGRGGWQGHLWVPPAPDAETAASLAGLMVAAAGGLLHFFRTRAAKRADVLAERAAKMADASPARWSPPPTPKP